LPRLVDATTITIMAMTVTIDGAGRLVVPLEVRKRLNLRNGSRLSLVADEDRILLEPERTEAVSVERGGVLVLQGELDGEMPDHRRLREDRLGRLAKP
jgi:AbrB family looped-hinge helix DNA binding protein